jgi:hypothetical protein
LRNGAIGAAAGNSRKTIPKPNGSISFPTRTLKSKKSMPIPEEMLKAVTRSERSSIFKFLGDKQPVPFALWFKDYFDDLCDAKLTIGEPVSLLDKERLSVCRLKTFIL